MEKIQIQCTSCNQKFEVTESYKGKMVECGACDHRFKVSGVAIISKKKRYYPGEKAQSNADNFAKSPVTQAELQENTKNNYAPKIDAARMESLSPGRKLCIGVGVFIILATIGIFATGGKKGGYLQNVEDEKRLIIAAFITLFGVILILYGSKARRVKALLFSIIIGGGLMAMPYVFPHKPITVETPDEDPADKKDGPNLISVKEYRENIGFSKVDTMRAEHLKKNGKLGDIKAVVLRDISIQDLDIVIQYIKDTLILEDEPADYSGHRSLDQRPITLLVFKAPHIKKQQVINCLKNIGTIDDSHPATKELDLYEVTIDNSIFSEVDPAKLSDPTDRDFYKLNYKELYNIDRDRRIAAVQRIRGVNQLGLKADIISRLNNMISPADIELSNEVILTLTKWTQPEYNSDEHVRSFAMALRHKSDLPPSILNYLIEKKVTGISDFLAAQWASSNGGFLMEKSMISAGKEGELAIIKALPNAKGSHIKSAATILEKIGSTAEAESALSAAIIGADADDQKKLKAAIDAVRSRR